MNIVDRRLNPGGKSLGNRQRFLERSKGALRKTVSDLINKSPIRDIGKDRSVTVPRHNIEEPHFAHAPGGINESVLSGNKHYSVNDRIERQKGGKNSKGGKKGGDSGDTDLFRFLLTPEEFMNLLFDDLELPDLVRKSLVDDQHEGYEHAGYTTTGSPAMMVIMRTIKTSLMRRIALRRPKQAEIDKLKEELATCEGEERKQQLLDQIEVLERRRAAITFLNQTDLRYHSIEEKPAHISQAVMFCLMDVSGSMTEHKKDLAKRFYLLLYLFLTRSYKYVDVVFIRHTEKAQEVDEKTFFYDTESGGTVVSTALQEMARIVEERYNLSEWNIYAAETSDGDNFASDNEAVSLLMQETILPSVQYFAYLEVDETSSDSESSSSLWGMYQNLCASGAAIAMQRVKETGLIYPVFRELFQKKEAVS